MAPDQDPANVNPADGGRKRPKLIGWIVLELGIASLLALAAPLLARSSPSLRIEDVLILHCLYALCWGALGACVNAMRALAMHLAAQDFDEHWNWWYFSKPPLGAILGLASLVLMKGLGAAMGGTSVSNGFGIAALAFVAGFATERVVHKVEDLSKTLFATQESTPTLAILEPVHGQTIGGGNLAVVVQVTGAVTYLSATCKESALSPVVLKASNKGQYEGSVTIVGEIGRRTIHVTGVTDGQVVNGEVVVNYAS